MAGLKRIKTEHRNIYYNTDTGKYDIKYNYKVYNMVKQKNDYKAKWKYGIATMEEAIRELQRLQGGEGIRKEPGITLKEAFELWKNKAKAQNYSKMTIKNAEYYVKMLSEFISPDTRIEDITEDVYEEVFSKCRDKYSDETIKTLNATFRKLINLAYKKRLIKENPLARADNMKTKRTEKVRVITTEEWRKLDEYFSEGKSRNDKLRFMLHILYYTGIRIGECLALTWEDFEEFGEQRTGIETKRAVQTGVSERGEQTGVAEKGERTGVSEREEQTRVPEKEERTRVSERNERTGVSEREEQTRVSEKEERTRVSEKEEQTRAPEREERTRVSEKQEQIGISETEKQEAQECGRRMRLNISKTILQDGTPKDTTKNKKNRKIPLSPEVVKLYSDGCRTRDKKERIFVGTYYTYICHITVACKKIGIPHCSCHSFRHTFISNLMRKGVPLPVIEKVSGDTEKTIFERYSHMFDDDEKLVLKALEDL